MRHVFPASFGLCLAVASMAPAQDMARPVVVVELYTSQGCSSCPPADDFLAALARDPGIIALSLHVDYWDYIGWADQFADPGFTERQKSYARFAGSRMIYTPQMIVGGVDKVEGNRPTEVEAVIRRHQKVAQTVVLQVERQGELVVISAPAPGAFAQPAQVQLVRYRPEATVIIDRGENAGRTITYHNVVTSWQALGAWTGETPLAMTAQASGADPAVVIVQHAGPANILAAARID